jgi:hypothetical protein
MSLVTLFLVQAVSFTPTLENTRTLPAALLTQEVVVPAGLAPSPEPVGFAIGPIDLRGDTAIQQSIDLSDGYYTRLDIHRYASYGTLPLFAIEAIAGQKLLEEGSGAPLWAEQVHKPAAYLVAGIFAVNTITGLLNYGEAKKIRQGRSRRKVHTILMLASTAGFIYSGTQAPTTSEVDERIANGTRGGWTRHKASAWASMTVATVGYLMMYVWKDD